MTARQSTLDGVFSSSSSSAKRKQRPSLDIVQPAGSRSWPVYAVHADAARFIARLLPVINMREAGVALDFSPDRGLVVKQACVQPQINATLAVAVDDFATFHVSAAKSFVMKPKTLTRILKGGKGVIELSNDGTKSELVVRLVDGSSITRTSVPQIDSNCMNDAAMYDIHFDRADATTSSAKLVSSDLKMVLASATKSKITQIRMELALDQKAFIFSDRAGMYNDAFVKWEVSVRASDVVAQPTSGRAALRFDKKVFQIISDFDATSILVVPDTQNGFMSLIVDDCVYMVCASLADPADASDDDEDEDAGKLFTL